MGRWIKRAIITGLLAYLAYASLMIWLHPRFIYPFYPDPFVADGYEEVSLPVPDSTPVTLYIARANQGAPVVIYFMGNAGSLALFRPLLEFHRKAGRQVIAMGYRGGGGLAGMPSETQLKRDARAVMEALPDLEMNGPVIVQGYSLGTGVATHIAARYPIDGLILAAPYEKLCQLMARASYLPACWLPGVQDWNTAADAPKVRAPVLVLHGDQDALIPIEDGQRLSQAFEKVRFVTIAGAGHTNLYSTPPYLEEITSFLTEISR